jgi:hypothetical protein
LERYIYSAGYGPTNETLGKFIRETFGQHIPTNVGGAKGGTALLERTSRIGKPAEAP